MFDLTAKECSMVQKRFSQSKVLFFSIIMLAWRFMQIVSLQFFDSSEQVELPCRLKSKDKGGQSESSRKVPKAAVAGIVLAVAFIATWKVLH